MSARDDLLRRFQGLAARRGSVRLLNAYRGIPVAHPAVVLAVHQGYVALEVHPHQATCMLLENKTHLLGDIFPQTLQARVVSVDMLRSQAMLAEFSRAQASIGKRLTVRVQPVEPLDAQIYDGEHRTACKLADISSSGVGLTALNTHVYGAGHFNKGQQVFVDIKFPGSPSPLRLQAKVTNLVVTPDSLLQRVGMTIAPDGPAQDTLREYVATRQAETLEELQRVHETLCRKQGVG